MHFGAIDNNMAVWWIIDVTMEDVCRDFRMEVEGRISVQVETGKHSSGLEFAGKFQWTRRSGGINGVQLYRGTGRANKSSDTWNVNRDSVQYKNATRYNSLEGPAQTRSSR